MDPDRLRQALQKIATKPPHKVGAPDKEEPHVKGGHDARTHPPATPHEHAQDQMRGAQDQGSLASTNSQTLYSWEAPVRAYKRKPAGVMRFYAAVAVLLSLLVVFFREYLLIVPIWAVMFLVYVLTITPPHTTRHSITRFGIHTLGRVLLWDELYHYYIIQKFGYFVLVLTLRDPYAAQAHLVVPDEITLKHVTEHLSKRIIFEENPRKTFSDKLAEWLTTLMPEEENQAAS